MVNFWGPKPREGTEAYRVQEEVKKILKVAENKKVKELIGNLYFNKIKYFPHWIKNNREYIPSSISAATERKEKDEKITEITLNDKNYKFTFKESSFSTPDGEHHTHGLLQLFEKDKKVFATNCSLDYDDYGSGWSTFSVEGFIDGDWIENFNLLKAEIESNDKEKEIRRAEDPEKTEKLKSDFGIK